MLTIPDHAQGAAIGGGRLWIARSDWNWGTILFWAQSNNAFPDKWWWFLPAGLCIALVGMALALINFGIDEYVNPRLRSAGQRVRALRKKGIRASEGVTHVAG